MIIFIKNKHTLELDEFKFKCCIGKKVLQLIKKKEIKKPQKELLIFNIFIIEKID